MSEAAIPQSVFDCGLGSFKAAGNYPPTSDVEENLFVSDLTALGADNQDFKDCASKWANTTTREEFTGEDAPGAMVVTFCRPEVRPSSAHPENEARVTDASACTFARFPVLTNAVFPASTLRPAALFEPGHSLLNPSDPVSLVKPVQSI